MRWRRYLGAVGIGCIFLILSGCMRFNGEIKETQDYTIGLVTKSKNSEYWMSVCSGAEAAAEKNNVNLLIVSPDVESNETLQKKMINDLIEKDVDALAISPIQSYDVKDYLIQAKQNNIFVVACDTKIVSDTVPYIGIDNYKAGQKIAKEMQEKLGDTGEVGVISGDLQQTTHAERLQGFQDYIEENTNMKIAFLKSGYSNLLVPESEIENLMESHPNVKGIFATSAVTALGLADYLKSEEISIMTVDAQQDALEAVEDGRIDALVAQMGYDIGYQTVEYIVENKEKQEDLDDEILNFEILNQSNAADWEEQNQW